MQQLKTMAPYGCFTLVKPSYGAKRYAY